MKQRICSALCFLFLLQSTQGQILRPSHWSEEHIRFLQMRGYLWKLSPLSRPIAVEALHQELQNDLTSPTNASAIAYERSLYLKSYVQSLGTESAMALIGVQTDNRYVDDHIVKTYAGMQRLQFNARPKPWLDLANTIVVDSRLDNSPEYMGISQSGFASYTEQAYLRLHQGGMELKIGRDYLRWGPGRDASLLIADISRPLDQLQLSYRHRFFRYTFFTSSLDPTNYAVNGKSERQLRYLSGHRLEVWPWRFLSLAVQEAILFGGAGDGYNLALINPFIFFHGEQMNGPDDGNTLGSFQLGIKPHRNWYFYGDLLVDDVQLEKTGPGDLEPSELGLIAGVNWSDPLWIWGLDLYAEYSAVTNRTYNALNPWEKWLHRHKPLGHFLGNDFDRLLAGFSYWPVSAWRGAVSYEHRRKGEGRIEKEFDSPWMETPVGQEYHEPFPTGVVESSDLLSLEVCWQPIPWLRVFGQAVYTSSKNWQNQKAVNRSFWQGGLGVSLEFYHSIHM